MLELGLLPKHDATGTLSALLFPQVVVVQPLPEDAVCGVQEATPPAGTLLVLQVVDVKLLPEFANTGLQLATGVAAELT